MRRTVRSALFCAAALAVVAPAMAQAPPSAEPPVMPIPRTAFRLERLLTRALPEAVIAKLGPVKTLAEAEAVLKAANISFEWGRVDAEVSALGTDLTLALAKLPPKEVFIIPNVGGGYVIGVILGQK